MPTPEEDTQPFGYCVTLIEGGRTYCVVYEYDKQTQTYKEVDRYEEHNV